MLEVVIPLHINNNLFSIAVFLPQIIILNIKKGNQAVTLNIHSYCKKIQHCYFLLLFVLSGGVGVMMAFCIDLFR